MDATGPAGGSVTEGVGVGVVGRSTPAGVDVAGASAAAPHPVVSSSEASASAPKTAARVA
ncbi:hypothetical protein [Agreia sp. Leaf210]|uniref:hypothetical protein n=1 Tax=Agreia sp. Leaf210 TaxID=1735682 RepID=UPI0006F2C18E|nr:hypothetical protein [Agreia sp. Leaf210]KQM59669.1 hypothetical protein ASE64_10145 [Agreia sp. Leaf210]